MAQPIEALALSYISLLCSHHDPSPALLGAPPLLARSPAGDFAGARSQALTLRTLATSYELLRKNRTASCREVYYMHAALMEDAGEAASAIASAQRALGGVPRHALGLFAAARGLYAGLLRVGGAPCDAAAARAIPSDCVCAPAGIAPAGARFLLLVEKAAIFQRLVEDRVWLRPGLECALVTGCGQPDLATRAFLRQAADAHPGIPVLGLVDYNPFGLGILLTYAHGSRARPEAAAHAVPELRWLGLRGSDLQEHALPRSVMQPLGVADERRCAGLLAAGGGLGGCSALAGEVEAWVEGGVKAELEALMALGVEYLVDTFLPRKLQAARQAAAAAAAAAAGRPPGHLNVEWVDALQLPPPGGGGAGAGAGAGAGRAPAAGGGEAGAAGAAGAAGGEAGEWDWAEEEPEGGGGRPGSSSSEQGEGGAGPAQAADDGEFDWA